TAGATGSAVACPSSATPVAAVSATRLAATTSFRAKPVRVAVGNILLPAPPAGYARLSRAHAGRAVSLFRTRLSGFCQGKQGPAGGAAQDLPYGAGASNGLPGAPA